MTTVIVLVTEYPQVSIYRELWHSAARGTLVLRHLPEWVQNCKGF
jgi:hypothetical protein